MLMGHQQKTSLKVHFPSTRLESLDDDWGTLSRSKCVKAIQNGAYLLMNFEGLGIRERAMVPRRKTAKITPKYPKIVCTGSIFSTSYKLIHSNVHTSWIVVDQLAGELRTIIIASVNFTHQYVKNLGTL